MLNSVLALLYPPLCLHCAARVEEGCLLLCQECLSHLQLIDPCDRCHYCFFPEVVASHRVCADCLKQPPLFQRLGAAFDYMGPAGSLVKALKYNNRSDIAPGMSAYLVAQFFQLNWPIPDLVVPVPISRVRRFIRGYNQCELLGRDFAKALDRPLVKALVRKSGDYPQASLLHHQRKILQSSQFSLARKAEVHDRTILLIDDVVTTSRTLMMCSEVLLEGGAAKIYALTFCRALD